MRAIDWIFLGLMLLAVLLLVAMAAIQGSLVKRAEDAERRLESFREPLDKIQGLVTLSTWATEDELSEAWWLAQRQRVWDVLGELAAADDGIELP